MKIKLFLTYDHELPLGKLKTSYESSLFEPTQKVMDIANELGVGITLFTDILCAQRFYEWDKVHFYDPYKNQLQKALKSGHDVQLHIHPHWLTTNYKNGAYFPSTDFGLSDFVNSEEFGGIGGIITQGIDGINNICKDVNLDYKCLAYRAGGYNIAPATKEIFQSLYKNGICYDSSMAHGFYFKSGMSEVDFRKLPNKPNWFVNSENLQDASNTHGIIEIPIACIPKTLFEIPTAFKMKKYAYRAPINHGQVIHIQNQVDKIAKLKMLFSSRMLSFDNYTLSLKYLLRILDYNVLKHNAHDTLMLSIISHPKSMGKYSFELMKNFIQEVYRKYPNVEFLTYTQLHQLTSAL